MIQHWEIIDAVAPDGHDAKSGTPEHVALTEAALREVALEITSAGARMVLIALMPLLPPACGELETIDDLDCRRRVDEDRAQPLFQRGLPQDRG